MLRWIIKNIKHLRLLTRGKTGGPAPGKDKSEPLSVDLCGNLERIKGIFAGANDAVIREFQIGIDEGVRAFLVFIDGLVDRTAVNESIMKPLLLGVRRNLPEDGAIQGETLTLVKERLLAIAEVREAEALPEVVEAVLSGDTAVFLEGSRLALLANTRGWEARGIEEPDTEVVVRGPREGFTETLRTSTAQLRRKIKTPDLKFETMKIGRRTRTDVCVAYIKGIANEKIVEEVKRRLERIDTDSVLESGYLEQFIEDAPFSFFPTVGNSEKPDLIAAKLLEGRVAILTDGTPFVLTVPYLFVEAFQACEDYYSRPFYATIVRWIRWAAFFLSVFLPAIYVAVETFHQEMIPSALLITMAAATEGTPFPAVVEALGMGVIFEILREAGVRLPRPIGQAISIVGALVIGEAAVAAGLIGAPVVIVVALTAIGSFVTPSIGDAASVMRFFLTVMAGVLGQFGIMLGIAGILTHMASLRSFGVPYLSPLAPTIPADLKDVLVRAPWWAMSTRPRLMSQRNPFRQEFGLRPEPLPSPDDDPARGR